MPALPSTAYSTEILNLIRTGHYLALYTSNPGPTNTGTEVTGGGYARKAITFGSITNAEIKNTAAITFPDMPTATITHYAIFSAATGGTMRVYGSLTNQAALQSGWQYQIPVNGLTIASTGA